jgi:hypothetical protein
MIRHTASLALLLGLAACGSTGGGNPDTRGLDHPVDISFGCFGQLRILEDGTADASDVKVNTAQPLASCSARTGVIKVVTPDPEHPDDRSKDTVSYPDRPPPPGQEQLTGETAPLFVAYYGFVLQSVPGTIALTTWSTQGFADALSIGEQGKFNFESVVYQDSDPATPGQNSVAVGEMPIAIATDRAGCQLITANAGSCDLSVVDITSIVDGDAATVPGVRSQEVTNALGEPVLARAAAMVAEPAEETQPIGVECPAEPEGLVYVAYPQCHLVAAVRAATGTIEAGLVFNADGTVAITDGNVSCPAECDEPGTFTDGGRPVTLDLVLDPISGTRRMVVGADDSATLTVVELGADYKPVSVDRSVTFEGDPGVLDVALSTEIGMGGTSGFDDTGAAGGIHQFVYAVADDNTVRVADIIGTDPLAYHECDTQVDPRFLRGLNDPAFLACMPVGDVATPPRRVLARSPGIELEPDTVPTAVAIVQAAWNVDDTFPFVEVPDAPTPGTLIGYFALITTVGDGTVIVNIDDDVYPDFGTPTAPFSAILPLAIAHQIRDNFDGRAERAVNNGAVVCTDEPNAGAGGPHVGNGDVTLQSDTDFINSLKTYTLPSLRRLECDGVDSYSVDPDSPPNPVNIPIFELGFPAPEAHRDLAFPDLRAVRNEAWTLTWQGLLSLDDGTTNVDGPITRSGIVDRSGGTTKLVDPSHPFCSMGAEPFDIAELVGCDPEVGDSQCGVGLTCFVHPDSVLGVGSCLPIDEATSLASRCRDFLTSQRRYTITTTSSGDLTLVPRRHVLETSPLDGCVSDTQCQTLADYREYLKTKEHPFEETPESPYTFVCEADPTRAAPVDQCVQSCTDSTDCDAGTVCSSGRCMESVAPPEDCIPGVQRYRVRAGEAITVVGRQSGYLHPIIEDPTTGACFKDPTASPLLTGRIPLTAPPCPGPDDFGELTPNPCSETVTHTELVPDYKAGSATCELESESGKLVTRDAPAIRFKNPSMTFDLVDPYYGGDQVCREDRAGTLGQIPTVHSGYLSVIEVRSGFLPKTLASVGAVLPTNVVRGPENSIWVIDEGDHVPASSDTTSVRGQVFRIESWNLGIVNEIE